MIKINFFSNGNCNNHGCEAIYLSLMNILGECEYTAYTENFEDDIKIINQNLKFIDIYESKNKLIETLMYKIKYKIHKNDRVYFDYKYKPFSRTLNKTNEIFLSVGGDNYCYGYNDWLKSLNEVVLKKRNKIILVGCSLEPESMDSDMLKTLMSFTAIIARESITFQTLVDKGLKNIFLKPDPAFILPIKEIEENNDNFFNEEVLGLNFSPLILKNSNREIIVENINNLFEYLIYNTTYNLLLIPHVMIRDNNDYEILLEFYNRYAFTNRVRIIQKHSASEIKGYISRCKMMIAARTHASIAAYSCCIPTLVIGYSIKSKGIAKDLFGKYEDYVLSIDQFSEEMDLIKAFMVMNDNYSFIKEHLEKIMPSYKKKCFEIRDIIQEFDL